MLASQLRLSFFGLSEANMLSILSHYQGQQGSYLSFDLPSSILSGLTASDFTLTGYSWRYAGSPLVEDFGDKLHTVTLTLESVPPEGAAVAGLASSVTVSLSAGPVTASSNAPAATWTVTASFEAGAADGGV